MGAGSKQTTGTKTGTKRRSQSIQRPKKSAGGRSAQAKPRATSGTPPPTTLGIPFLGTRAVGALLFVVGVYVLSQMITPSGRPDAPIGAISKEIGYALAPIGLLVVLFAASLIARPSWFSSIPVLRPISGFLLMALTLITMLGVGGVGGTVGNSLWRALSVGIGVGSLPALLVLFVASLLLIGISVSTLSSLTVRGASLLGKGISSAFLGVVGFVVWTVRELWLQPEPEVAPRPVKKQTPKPQQRIEPPPTIEVEETGTNAEATQEMLPIVRKLIDDPAPKPKTPHTDWKLPSIDLLEKSEDVEVSESDALQRARTIEDTLRSFGVEARVREVNPGPTVTQFALEPGSGVRVSRINALKDDMALALAASSIRVEAPVPGQSRVGLEVPNGQSSIVRLRDVMDSSVFYNSKGTLKLALGRDVTGRSVVGDLTRMPHMLIAGATGAGKSSCLNSTIVSFLFQCTPEDLRFLMVDPKMVELKTFDGIPHLIWPVVTELNKVVGLLKYAVMEMERRYKEFSKLGIRNLDGYNRKVAGQGGEKLPRIVIIIDELADLMMAAPDEVEASICRLAQMARAVGIHLIIATQRPSVDVLTGLIKANFPSRIAFAVSSQIDSRVILDMPGAERLLGRGDMLFLGPDSSKPLRVQGTFVSDEEIDTAVNFWKELQPAQYDEEVGRMLDAEASKADTPDQDPLFSQAVELSNSHVRLSTSLLQRKFRIGYNRAARLMDSLRDSGELDTELDD